MKRSPQGGAGTSSECSGDQRAGGACLWAGSRRPWQPRPGQRSLPGWLGGCHRSCPDRERLLGSALGDSLSSGTALLPLLPVRRADSRASCAPSPHPHAQGGGIMAFHIRPDWTNGWDCLIAVFWSVLEDAVRWFLPKEK